MGVKVNAFLSSSKNFVQSGLKLKGLFFCTGFANGFVIIAKIEEVEVVTACTLHLKMHILRNEQRLCKHKFVLWIKSFPIRVQKIA